MMKRVSLDELINAWNIIENFDVSNIKKSIKTNSHFLRLTKKNDFSWHYPWNDIKFYTV